MAVCRSIGLSSIGQSICRSICFVSQSVSQSVTDFSCSVLKHAPPPSGSADIDHDIGVKFIVHLFALE